MRILKISFQRIRIGPGVTIFCKGIGKQMIVKVLIVILFKISMKINFLVVSWVIFMLLAI